MIEHLSDHYRTIIERLSDHYWTIIEKLLTTIKQLSIIIEHLLNHYLTSNPEMTSREMALREMLSQEMPLQEMTSHESRGMSWVRGESFLLIFLIRVSLHPRSLLHATARAV